MLHYRQYILIFPSSVFQTPNTETQNSVKISRESSFSEVDKDLQESSSLTSVEKEEVYRTHNFRKERSKHERLEGGEVESELTDTAKAESEMESLKRSSMGLQKESREITEEKRSVDALSAFKEANQQFVESKTSSLDETSLSQNEQKNNHPQANSPILRHFI